ncbi:hypothetical protein D3C85_1424810 [compost metagenome]
MQHLAVVLQAHGDQCVGHPTDLNHRARRGCRACQRQFELWRFGLFLFHNRKNAFITWNGSDPLFGLRHRDPVLTDPPRLIWSEDLFCATAVKNARNRIARAIDKHQSRRC